MKILAKTKQHFDGREEYYNRLPLPSQVKRLGKYLEDHLVGVDKDKTRQPPNEYIIYAVMFYMVDAETRRHMAKYPDKFHGLEQEIYELPLYFNITTYNGKFIRVNIIQLDEYEKTLGFLRLDQMDLISLPACKQRIIDFAQKKLQQAYKDYEIMLVDKDKR